MRVIIIFNSNGIPRERITKIHKYFYLQEIERKSKKKNFNPNYASFVKKKKTITKDCRGYNYKKKNAEYEISRKANNIDKQIRAYALVSSFTEFMITQPKAIGGRAIVKWRSITRIYVYT